MDVFKNFLHLFRRYTAASILNLIGLTVAFASFVLIMMQVGYDLGYDRHYQNADRIFRVEIRSSSSNNTTFSPWHSPDLIVSEQIAAVSPNAVKSAAIKSGSSDVYNKQQQLFTIGNYGCWVVSKAWFDLFGFECVSGSFNRIDQTDAAILSESLARRIFPDGSPIGEILFLDAQENPIEIIAVYKDFPKNSTVKNGIYLTRQSAKSNRSNARFYTLADDPRHKQQIEETMTSKAREIHGDSSLCIRLTPLYDVHFSTDCHYDLGIEKGSKMTIYSLIGIAVLILCIAMINSINFAIALVPLRIRSLNTRKIFGCSVTRLRLGLIAENIGMTLTAFVLALIIVYTLAPSLGNLFREDISVSANQTAIWLSAVITCLVGLLGGLYPAFYSTSFNPAFVTKGDFSHSHSGQKLRKTLVAIQFVISITLITIAFSVHKQTRFMTNHDPGFRPQNILTTTISRATARQANIYAERLKSYPEIEDVAFGFMPLAQSMPAMSRDAHYKGETMNYYLYLVSANFISFMDLKIVEGRSSTEADKQKEAGVFIFNQTAQKKCNLEVGTLLDGGSEAGDIIGIVQDFNFQPLNFPITPMAFYIYGKTGLFGLRTAYIKVKGSDIASAMEHIRKTGFEFDPRNKDQNIVFMDQAMGNLYQKEQDFAKLITLFSLLSVLISVIGVFGLILFETRHRRKEIGVRKVHGATVGEIIRMFNKTYVRIVLICFVIAAPIAYFSIRKWIEQFAYKTSIGIGVFLAALVIVLLVVVATISIQCYKTANANPVDSIKKE